jgi:hypothetical protein
MPKRLLIVLAAVALTIAACNSNSSSSTPSPSFSPSSPAPNPSIHKATVMVTINGTPAPRIPVDESTPRSTSSPRPGTPFDTQKTGKKGLAHFHQLKPNKIYCWVAKISPSFKSSECAGWGVWQNETINLGT